MDYDPFLEPHDYYAEMELLRSLEHLEENKVENSPEPMGGEELPLRFLQALHS
jgi:hypothetical protein